uniref:probable pectinesterase/pectinesterase inhibitor 51 n=1 Tax=Erigeron canadensis TaxID=72917 RepID=UPI001CB8BFB1|nr:probable pectinesterase/pectinesterase inhibitor 51 [Erigeron canadensis]
MVSYMATHHHHHILIYLLVLIIVVSHVQSSNPWSSSAVIKEACKSTRFPTSCQLSLIKSGLVSPDHSTPFQVLQSALSVSSNNLEKTRFMIHNILNYSKNKEKNHTTITTTQLCLDVLSYSAYRLKTAEKLFQHVVRIKDARAWTSAALSYQFDCLSGLKKVHQTQMVSKTCSFMNNTLLSSTSNALSMMMSYQEFGNITELWRSPKTEREGFWESLGDGSGTSGHKPGVPGGLKANVTVCKGRGVCTYEKVQTAINAAPDNLARGEHFVIGIREGVYEEIVRVGFAKRNVVLIGDGMGKTVITGSLSVGKLGITTYDTATVGVVGDGFMARHLTIQNTAGPDAHQAVAFRSDSDLSVIENCEFIGNQDTLYAHSLRQLYKFCVIQGNVDFIFGNSASIFHKCTILIRPRQLDPEKGDNSVISAHGRSDPAQTTGFVFQECILSGTNEYIEMYRKNPQAHQTFLGRPWKEYSRSVFIKCEMDAIVSPLGWMRWDGDFALKTLYFGEFGNFGLGSNTSARVWWSSRTPPAHVYAYSMHNFIQADEWVC